MTEPARYDPATTPAVEWHGRKWPIPELAARQLDLIWDDVIALTEALRIEKEDEFGRKIYSLSADQMRRLRGVVYVGLTRAHGELTRDEFDDVPATPLEIVLAFFVVRNQSLIFGRPSKEAAVKRGEGERGASRISNGSSPAVAATSAAPAIIGGAN
jgi:hypothetical protein